MNIHLFNSSEVDRVHFSNVFSILSQFEGALQFVTNQANIFFDEDEIVVLPFDYEKFKQKNVVTQLSREANFNKKANFKLGSWPPPHPDRIKRVSWDSIFDKCIEYRNKNGVPEQEPVIILTDFVNDKNWFSASDPTGALNFFVCTGQWEHFLPCDPRFPVAYETIAVIFRHFLFGSFDAINQHAHQKARGCVNDFCRERREITLKLRTADLCPDCHRVMNDSNMNPLLIAQFFQTIDHIRTQMLFRERYKVTQQLSRLEIRGAHRKIIFTGLGNAELKLTPLEKTVYLLFLMHPEGIQINDVYKYADWIENEYGMLGNHRTLPELKNSIKQLTDPTENSLSEKISRIRSKIQRLIGEDLAMHYIIEGARSEPKKILLDRSLVDWN